LRQAYLKRHDGMIARRSTKILGNLSFFRLVLAILMSLARFAQHIIENSIKSAK